MGPMTNVTPYLDLANYVVNQLLFSDEKIMMENKYP